MYSVLTSAHSLRAAAPLAKSNRRPTSGIIIKPRTAMRSGKPEEHFEPSEPRGECLLADAR